MDYPLSEDVLTYWKENNWEVLMPFSLAGVTNSGVLATELGIFSILAEYGIPFWADLEEIMYVATVNGVAYNTAAVSDFEHDFGVWFDTIIAHNPKGIIWEWGMLNAVQWVYNKVHSLGMLMCQWFGTFDYAISFPPYTYIWWQTNGYGTFAQRLALVDEVQFEIYWIDAVDNAISMGQYLHDNYPNMPYGVETCLYKEYIWQSWWGYTSLTETPPTPYALQRQRLEWYMRYMKRELDNMPMNITVYCDAYLPYIKDYCLTFEAVGLDQPGTQGVQQMAQTGLIPEYIAASYCDYPPTTPPDIFANTGNEVILLKSYSGSSTHTVTVAGTTPNGLTKTENYTLTLSPNQGTPLGPFPVDQFGFNPTITYDTTNLYVAIIGAWRTGFEPL